MSKPTASYKMSTKVKRLLAGTFESKAARTAFKKAMIDAEITANAKPVNRKTTTEAPADDAV
jgi:hypothetical protein